MRKEKKKKVYPGIAFCFSEQQKINPISRKYNQKYSCRVRFVIKEGH